MIDKVDFVIVLVAVMFGNSILFYSVNDCIVYETVEIEGKIRQYAVYEDAIRKC